MMVGLIVDIKFAVCYFVILSVILSVCLARVSSETAEQIWLKVCTKTKVCPRHYTTLRILMKINCPRGPAMGAEMFFFRSTAVIFHRIRQTASPVGDICFIFVR